MPLATLVQPLWQKTGVLAVMLWCVMQVGLVPVCPKSSRCQVTSGYVAGWGQAMGLVVRLAQVLYTGGRPNGPTA